MTVSQQLDKAAQVPQTVENLLHIMAADAETMIAMQKEIQLLRNLLNQRNQTIRKLRKKVHHGQ